MTSSPDRRSRLRVGAIIVLVIAALTTTVVIGIVRSSAAPVESVSDAGSVESVSDAGSAAVTPAAPDLAQPLLYVHVTGSVASPGLYRLDAAARVADAIAAAGGLADDADPAGVNLARILSDGEQLHIPRAGEVTAPAAPSSGTANSPGGSSGPAGPVNLNTADEAALDTLPRIGPALAARIIAWREENGRFTSVEDLLAVPGIGEKMLAALREGVTV